MTDTKHTVAVRKLLSQAEELLVSNVKKATKYAEDAFRLTELHELSNMKVAILCLLVRCMREQRLFDEALGYAHEAEQWIVKFPDAVLEGNLRMDIGTIYYYRGEYVDALKHYEQGLLRKRSQNDSLGSGRILMNIGNIYKNLGDTARAMEYYAKALVIFTREKYQTGQAHTLNNIGVLHQFSEDYVRALENYERAYELKHQLGDKKGCAGTLVNLGNVHVLIEDYEQAIEYFQQALQINEEVGNRYGQATAKLDLGITLGSLQQYLEALEYKHQALTVFREMKEPYGQALTLHSIGKLYCKEEFAGYNTDTALQYLQEALRIAEESGLGKELAAILQTLAECYEQRLELTEAMNALRRSYQEKEKVINEDSIRTRENLFLLHKMKQIKQDVALQKEQNTILQSEKEKLEKLNKELTEAKQSIEEQSEKIMTSQKLFEQITLTTPHFLSVYDLQLKENIYQNRSLFESLGYSQEEISELQEREQEERLLFFHSDDRKAVREFLQRLPTIAIHEEYYLEYRVKNAHGEWEWLRRVTTVFEHEDGQPTHLLNCLEVITNAKRALIALEEKNVELHETNTALQGLQSEQKEFIGLIVHEVKNPINTIISACDLMGDTTDERSLSLIKSVRQGSTRIAKLIDNLLFINRIERDEFFFSPEPVRLEVIISDIVEMGLVQSQRKGITISWKPESITLVAARDTWTVMIVENLLFNAIKFSPKNTEITVSTVHATNTSLPDFLVNNICAQRYPECIVFTISDQGQGLTVEDKKHLFQKFARLSARPTGGESSTGLGLSIVRLLVNIMQGDVWAENIGDDEEPDGCRFHVLLPLWQSSREEQDSSDGYLLH